MDDSIIYEYIVRDIGNGWLEAENVETGDTISSDAASILRTLEGKVYKLLQNEVIEKVG